MATPFATFPVTAAQVGTYFVHQYYNLLQLQPEYVHQFYTDASTMLRINGATVESASAMLQIHTLIMSLSYTGVEIKTAHSLDSWNGGVMVMASGSVQLTPSSRKKFVQTFFLAPQEKGFFVLNDFFHFIDDESVLQHPAVLLAQSAPINRPSVPAYLVDLQNQTPQFVMHGDIKENGSTQNYHLPEKREPQAFEPKPDDEDKSADHANDSTHTSAPTHSSASTLQQPTSPSIAEPQKLSYASILRIAKGQPAPALNPNTQSVLERSHPPPTLSQQQSSTAFESPAEEKAEEAPIVDNEGEVKSVYVRNLPTDVTVRDVEEQFKNFGKLKPEGVVIRSREDVGACYAFVEFEDIEGVQNAVKASTTEIGGRQVFIEERRAKNGIQLRGSRRGRARGNYQTDGPRVRSGNRYGRDGGDRDYRPRGNGVYRQVYRHDNNFPNNQAQRNGQKPLESTA